MQTAIQIYLRGAFIVCVVDSSGETLWQHMHLQRHQKDLESECNKCIVMQNTTWKYNFCQRLVDDWGQVVEGLLDILVAQCAKQRKKKVLNPHVVVLLKFPAIFGLDWFSSTKVGILIWNANDHCKVTGESWPNASSVFSSQLGFMWCRHNGLMDVSLK